MDRHDEVTWYGVLLALAGLAVNVAWGALILAI
jgi:hypothetical protein